MIYDSEIGHFSNEDGGTKEHAQNEKNKHKQFSKNT